MRLLLALTLCPALAAAATPRAAAPAAKPPAGLILLGAPARPLQLNLNGGALILPEAPKVLQAPAPAIVAPGPLIVPAARTLTPEEAAPSAPLSGAALARLADSLAGGEAAAARKSDEGPAALGEAYDGALAPGGRDGTAALAAGYFASPAAGPELGGVAATARALFARLLPRLDRKVEARVVYDLSSRPSTGHTWSKEKGHRIEILPEPADGRGEVASAFGIPDMTRVQRKTERLMLVAHERGHVVFDDAVGRRGDHGMASAYAAMTEGFAVTLEGLFIDRLMADPLRWGLGPRDAADLLAIRRARAEWLAAMDTHYSEGALPWARAFERGGEDGLLAFLARLSASRMAEVKRADPAYQLAAGDPGMLGAYLGRDAADPARQGLEAFAKAARGEELTAEQARAASAALERAGEEGRRRVFERTLRVDRAVAPEASSASEAARWWERPQASSPSVEPAFALARLSPAGAAELAAFLAEQAARGALGEVFGGRGPGSRLDAVVKGAETLPFSDADRATWLDGLMAWLTGL